MQLELALKATGLRQALSWLQGSLDCTFWTRHMHAANGRYLLKYFGDAEVSTLSYPKLRSYFDDERRRGRAKETIRKRLSTLKMALREAMAHGSLERLPDWPMIRGEVRTKDELWTLIQMRAATLACDDDDFAAWLINGWWSGAHSSDLDRFRWEDVDLVAGTWVRRNTKTKIRPAKLPMPAEWHKYLKERFERLQPHPRDLVAGQRMGHPNRQLRALCERAGVPSISPIRLRHSCETYLEECGTSEAFQMNWLGLLTAKPLKRHYRHVSEKMLSDGAGLIDAATKKV